MEGVYFFRIRIMDTEFFKDLVGWYADTDSIKSYQMAVRAVIVFMAALAMLRVVGSRSFGRDTAFDLVLKFTIGSMLSRAVVAASPFGATLLACTVFVGLHHLLAIAAYRFDVVGRIIKGKPVILAQQGQLHRDSMRHSDITEEDMLEGIREGASIASADQADTVWLERSGTISVVKKQDD
jgi:uncharacterized membrane protein YcaP (DUF421 family)